MKIGEILDCEAFVARNFATVIDRVTFEEVQPTTTFTDLIARTYFRLKPYTPNPELSLRILQAEIFFPNITIAGTTLLNTNNGYTSLEFINQKAENFPITSDGTTFSIDSESTAFPAENFGYLAAEPNYSAWLLGELPRLARYRKLDDIKILLHGDAKPFHFDTLSAYGIDRDRLILADASKKITARNFFYATHGYFHHIVSPTTLNFLHGNLKRVPTAAAGKRVYISRSGAPTRKILNETELEDELRCNGFDIISPETMNFTEQVAVFKNAETIVAPFGAALANLVYVNSSCKVIILTTKFTKEFARILNLRGIDFYVYNGFRRNLTRYFYPSKLRERYTNYRIDIDRLLTAILAVEKGQFQASYGGLDPNHRALKR